MQLVANLGMWLSLRAFFISWSNEFISLKLRAKKNQKGFQVLLPCWYQWLLVREKVSHKNWLFGQVQKVSKKGSTGGGFVRELQEPLADQDSSGQHPTNIPTSLARLKWSWESLYRAEKLDSIFHTRRSSKVHWNSDNRDPNKGGFPDSSDFSCATDVLCSEARCLKGKLK